MWDDIVKPIGIITIALTIFLTILVIGIQGCNLNVIDTVPVKVMIDNNLVYEGKSGCVKVSSGGRTTTVTILGGFMCFYPQKEYVSDNVHIEGVK